MAELNLATTVKQITESSIDSFYDSQSAEEKRLIYEKFRDPEIFDKYQNALEKLIFKKKPPSVWEFLNVPDTEENGWLSKKILDSIYPHIKEDFYNILDPKKNYTQSCSYGCTRQGKSTLSRLIVIYIIVYFHHLRDPGLFYGKSNLTEFCIYLISFKLDKSRQILIRPLFKIMEQSKKFVKLKSKDDVIRKQQELGINCIAYSTASLTGYITLNSGLQLHSGNSDSLSFIGADVIFATISELAYFIHEAGTSEEEIFELYSNLLSRIRGTVGRKYLAQVFLDTSANRADSDIEKHIINKLQYDPLCYFTWRSQWDTLQDQFPLWNKRRLEILKEQPDLKKNEIEQILYDEGLMFEVCSGNGGIRAFIIERADQKRDIPNDLIIKVPIDVKGEFELKLEKSLKDTAGVPTSNESKFIGNKGLILNIFNNKSLVDNNQPYILGSEYDPEGLLFNMVKDKYFSIDDNGHYYLPRASHAYRYIGVDSAYSKNGDVASITVGHKEYNSLLNCKMYVADMILTLKPSKEGIGLSAMEYFIYDLITKGNVSIKAVATDTFQSEFLVQGLKRYGVEVVKNSVDSTIVPYMSLLTALQVGTLKAGYSNYLENNLSCLEVITTEKGKEKVDHPKSTDTDQGKNAKDVSDSLTQSHYIAVMSIETPSYDYDFENSKFSNDKVDIMKTAIVGKANIISSMGSVLRI